MGRKTKKEKLSEIEEQIQILEDKKKKLSKEIQEEEKREDERKSRELLKTLKSLGITDMSKLEQDLRDIYSESTSDINNIKEEEV